jgi:Zn-dependent alcohol dehydrogenase
MIAAVLTQLNAPLELAEVTPLGPAFGQVQVKMLASGICGSQLAEIRGEKGNAGNLPHLLGHEGCGIVQAVGPGVRKVKPDDRVVIHWRKGSGIESDFPRYDYAGKTITSGKAVTFAKEVLVSENRVTPIPAEFPAELGALFGCGFSTAMATLEHEADLKSGERLLVIGAGGIGLNLLAAAHLSMAVQRTCCDILEAKREAVQAAGAQFVCKRVPKELRGTFDVVVDTVGSGSSFSAGMESLAPSGRMILVGQAPADLPLRNSLAFFGGEGQTIKATQGGGFNPDRDIPRWVRLWREMKLNHKGVISHRFPLEQINEAIDVVRKGEAGRVLLTFDA